MSRARTWRSFRVARLRSLGVIAAIVCLTAPEKFAVAGVKPDDVPEAAKQAYEHYEYPKAVEFLQAAIRRNPQNGDAQLLLAKSYYEMEQWDAAASTAELAVSINPNDSSYHEWLGRAYGEKADRAGGFTALSLAKKTHRELETAVRLNDKNFSATQALIEYDCSAPGIAGGGEDKARPLIQRLAQLNEAEGHYAEGNCRRHKKDYASAEVEFTKALESKPESADLIYDIADHEMKRGHPEQLLKAVQTGEELHAGDPRGEFYRGVAMVMENDKPEEAERLLRAYLKKSPIRTGYPKPAETHYWIGKLYEAESNRQKAIEEYREALKLDSRNRLAREAIKKMGKG
jgi:tetratricopeptide (TPR) repeat protein